MIRNIRFFNFKQPFLLAFPCILKDMKFYNLYFPFFFTLQIVLEKDGTEINDYDMLIDLIEESKRKPDEVIFMILAEGTPSLSPNFLTENNIVPVDGVNGTYLNFNGKKEYVSCELLNTMK